MSKIWGNTRTPPDSVLQTVSEIYQRGQTLDALKVALEFAPLKEWAGISACCLATRIAANTGGNRLARRLAVCMWHADRHHPLSQFEYGVHLMQLRGPLAFWLAARSWPAMRNESAKWQADVAALKSRAASELREFTVAEKLIQQAEAIAPNEPWIRLQHAFLLERMEKVEEALEIATAASRLHPHPFYRPAVQVIGHLLQLLDRDEEALQLLRQADAHLQNQHVALQLYTLLSNLQRWEEAGAALQRYEILSPLLEFPVKLWLQGELARVAHGLGKRAEALKQARELKDPFNQHFAEKLALPPAAPERVRLEVPFVRQHFKTCAPATMAALGKYWKMPSEHVALIEAICYDGTPSWQQRDWAERNAWLVREFRVTWESATALLKEGIPFALTTVEATSGHMQAVMGFDETRGTLLLREPSQPFCLESFTRPLLDRYRAFGPRGMVFIPKPEAARLECIPLPDAGLYDEYHIVSLALSKHEREKARAALARLESSWPDHAITWEARLELAAYDTNFEEQILCLDRLLEMFPNNPTRLLRRLHCMRDAAREERIEFLEKACADKAAGPALFVELAKLLSADGPQQAAAANWLRRAARCHWTDSNYMGALGELIWRQGKYEEATELYRFAAAAEGYREHLYQTWFAACSQIRQQDVALAHLEDRFHRFGNRSAQPALTLAWALREIEQPDRACKVLAEAIRLRPDDGQLFLRAAGLNARLGDHAQAEAMLAQARGRVRENDWVRTAAEIAELRFDAPGALLHLRQLLSLEPLAVDAHGGMARVLSQLEGRSAALAHLQDACAQNPHHCALQRLLITWAHETGYEAVLGPAAAFLKISPGDAWTHRELAWALANLNRYEEALAEAQESLRIEPRSSAGFVLQGHVQERLHRFDEARESFRKALSLSVDQRGAINGLLRLASTDEQRKEELAFIERELIRQVVRGDGLLAYMEAARPLMKPEALLGILRQAHAERPDLWHAWSALVLQLDHLGLLDEAVALAKQAATRFPHLPRIWLDLATVHQTRKETNEEIAAAQRAFELNPTYNRAAFALANALERHRSLAEAKIVYERALRNASSDAQLHLQLASILWRLREPQEALASVEAALRRVPSLDYAWNWLVLWSSKSGQPERAVNFARELTRERPGDAYAWLMFAKVQDGRRELAGSLEAVNRALALAPHVPETWDFKAELLAESLQFDAAIEACDQAVAAFVPNAFMVRGRRAWIEAQRGKTSEAIQQMHSVLAENAGYAWGWHQLAIWLTSQQAFVDAEKAIEQLLKLQPGNIWAQRQRAVLRLKQGNKAGAEKVFSEILASSPTDQFAAENLFNLQLEVSNFKGAAETLHRMQTHQPGARVFSRELILKLRTGDKPGALKLFQKLCTQPDPDPAPVQSAADALVQARLGGATLKILKSALAAENCNQQAGATATQMLINKSQCARAAWLFERIRSPEVRKAAAPTLAEGLGRLKARLVLWAVLKRHRKIFFNDDAAWGQVGYALTRLRRTRAAADWLADWRSRPNAEAWMFFNLCYALRKLGRYAQANEAAEFAVQKWGYRPQDGADLRLFLAVEKAFAGPVDEAAEHVKKVHIRKNVLYDQHLLAIAKAMLDFQRIPAANRRKEFGAIRDELNRVFPAGSIVKADRDVKKTFRRAGKYFVQNGAGPLTAFWFLSKLYWRWLLLLIPAFFLAFALFGH